ncbi:unnamed protein product, partial [Mesorhabditis belari]|uniref:G-protein coupled receptors family 1 profile domain-containing protein n=1 Tax=Mesorhabditis belari TaxID=2138241 RepID=A0AAF3ENT2_9BILA
MSSAFYRWKTMTTNCLQALTSKVTKKASLSSANQELANEHKATRVLAVVFVCFFICWTPFFIANFTYGFCGEACELPPWMGSVFLWLGYISSTINPLIYTIFNKRFRQAFVRILRCQCFHSLRDPYSFYSRHTTILPDTYYTCLLPLAYHVSSNAERATSREENGVGDGMTTRKEAAEFLMRSIRQKYPGSKIDQWISEGPSSPDQNGGKIEIGSRRGTRAITLDGPLPPPLPRPVTMVRRSMTSIGTSMITSNHSMFHSASSDWVTASMENSTNNKEKTDDSINEWIDSSNECPCPVLSTARASLMETSATTTTSCSTSGGSPSMILFNTVFSRPVRETFL